jgi:hypothetical protein
LIGGYAVAAVGIRGVTLSIAAGYLIVTVSLALSPVLQEMEAGPMSRSVPA